MRRAISIIILAMAAGLAACAGAPAPGGTGAGTNAATLVGTPTTQPTDDVDVGAKAASVLDYLKTHYMGSLPGEAVTGEPNAEAVMSVASGRQFVPKATFEKQHVVQFDADRMVATVYPGAIEVPFEIDEKGGELSSKTGSPHALNAAINWLSIGVISERYPLRIALDGEQLFEVEDGVGETAIQRVSGGPNAPFLQDPALKCLKNEARVKHDGRFGIGGSISIRVGRNLVATIHDWCDEGGAIMELACDTEAELGYVVQQSDLSAHPGLTCEGRKLVGSWTDDPVAFSLLALDICTGQPFSNCIVLDIHDGIGTLLHAAKFNLETLGAVEEYHPTSPKDEMP